MKKHLLDLKNGKAIEKDLSMTLKLIQEKKKLKRLIHLR